MTGDQRADSRQDSGEIPTVQIPWKTLRWFGEFEDGSCAARLEHAVNLAETRFVIGKVAEAESACHQIKGSIRKGQAESVGFEKWNGDARRRSRMPWGEPAFHPGADKHGMGKIRAKDTGFPGVSESKSEIAGSATQIENQSVGALKDRSKALRSASAPPPIQLER